MTPLQEDKIKQLAENPVLLQAIGALFDETIENLKPRVLDTDDDRVIGQKYRAYDKTKEVLMEVMKTIINYKDFRENNTTPNKGL
jgi:hypothetical protein